MINHISIGVKRENIARARRFYDAVLAPLGYKCLSESREALGYGDENARFWVLSVARPIAPDEASGLHVCFDAKSRTAVDAFHAAAVRSGGRDNGGPGLRQDYGDNYYAAFVIDPDGYRLEAYCSRDQ